MSKHIRTDDLMESMFPLGCRIKDKETGSIYVRGTKDRNKYWCLAVGKSAYKRLIPSTVLVRFFELEPTCLL